MQSFLYLVEKAEKHASIAAETANAANNLVKKLLGNHSISTDLITDHELHEIQLLKCRNDMEIAQQRAKQAEQEYQQLKSHVDELQLLRQSTSQIQPNAQENEILHSIYHSLPTEQPLPPQPHQVTSPVHPELPPETVKYTATGNTGLPRNQITGILATAEPPNMAKPQLSASGFGPIEQAVSTIKTATPAKLEIKKDSHTWQYFTMPLVALVLLVCLRLLVFDVVQVSGISMTPTIQPMDSLISSKIAYRLHDPQRFDIILLDAPDQSGYFIKRIIGLPNEQIMIMDGSVYINGELLDEEFLDNIYTTGNIDTIIPADSYFVMGDNRPASLDSRADTINSIAKEHINGKAILRFYPFNSFKML